jgi:hypothetical protein
MALDHHNIFYRLVKLNKNTSAYRLRLVSYSSSMSRIRLTFSLKSPSLLAVRAIQLNGHTDRVIRTVQITIRTRTVAIYHSSLVIIYIKVLEQKDGHVK